jgi:hypothetical protein
MTVGRAPWAVLGVVLAAAALAACNGAKPDAAPVEAPAPAAAEPPAPPPGKPWKDLTKDEKAGYMKHVVMPAMKGHFAAFDPDEFGKMNCSTCHGKDAKAREFKMPNPGLPKLPTDPEGWKELEEDDAKIMAFMKETVVPKMAALLSEETYDPKTQKGFGCFRCHTTK